MVSPLLEWAVHRKRLLMEEFLFLIDLLGIVSGPDGLIDNVRSALSLGTVAGPISVLKGEASVHLNVEQFKM